MSHNDFKRLTGYYTIQGEWDTALLIHVLINATVIRAAGSPVGAKDLYVEVRVKDLIRRTRGIRNASHTWNETLPM